MQRLQCLLLLLIAFLLASISYFASHHLSVKSALIAGVTGNRARKASGSQGRVTDVEERNNYNIHSWQDSAPVTQATVKAKRVIYNRVGKCGSRTVIQLMATLARKNSFTVVGSTRYNIFHLKLREQVEFVDFLQHLRAPFIYHQHSHYIDFKKFDAVQPIYFNLIRDPLSRLVSSYYYLRFGDYREDRTWSFKGTAKEKNMTFDECVLNELKECVDPAKIFNIVPYFCGHEDFCRKPSQLALRQAKINVITSYLVVGVTDEFEDFLSVLEKLLPEFFKGVLEIYKKPDDLLRDRMTTAKTMNKKGPSAEVEKIMKKHLELEYDFYYFVKDRFHRLKAELNT